MKSKILILLLFLTSLIFAQTTIIDEGRSGDKKVYFTVTTEDSTESFYSDPIDIALFRNVALSTVGFGYEVKTVSSDGACSLYVSIQGRNVAGADQGDWVELGDTLNTLASETAKLGTSTLNSKLPDQIRFHVDGLANNRADAKVEVWFTLNQRGQLLLR